jgi:hypothetical protein
MWRSVIRLAGAPVGAVLVYFASTIIRESRFDGLGLSGLEAGVSLSYAVAGALLVVPWRILRPLLVRRLAFVLLLVCSTVGLVFGFLPALSWSVIHGAAPPAVLLAVALGLCALLANLGLGVRDLLLGFGTGEQSPDSAAA